MVIKQEKPWNYVSPSRIKKKEREIKKKEREIKKKKKQEEYNYKHRFEIYAKNVSDWDEAMKSKKDYLYIYHIVGYDNTGKEVSRAQAANYRQMMKVRAKIYKERGIWMKFKYTKDKVKKTRINR